MEMCQETWQLLDVIQEFYIVYFHKATRFYCLLSTSYNGKEGVKIKRILIHWDIFHPRRDSLASMQSCAKRNLDNP
jgi:hypothetical protein